MALPDPRVEVSEQVVVMSQFDGTEPTENPDDELLPLFFGELIEVGLTENHNSRKLRRRRRVLKRIIHASEDGLGRGGSDRLAVLPNLHCEVNQRGERCDRCQEFADTSEILDRHFRGLTSNGLRQGIAKGGAECSLIPRLLSDSVECRSVAGGSRAAAAALARLLRGRAA